MDNMLATHERIQRMIFKSANEAENGKNRTTVSVVEFLRQCIEQRFGVKDIPDGYFFWPSVLGGLEVQSPFVRLVKMRDSTVEDPGRLIDVFLKEEEDAYRSAKADFEAGETEAKLQGVIDPSFKPKDSEKFFSFEEFSKFREVQDEKLVDIFNNLLETSPGQNIEGPENIGEVIAALCSLGGHQNLHGIKANWYDMDSYWQWVVQLYSPEMIERFGGLRIVDPGLLPTGMVSLLRSARLDWQE